MKKTIALLLTAALIFISGCENAEADVEETTTATEAPEPQPYPVTVNDAVINACPEKIVCLSPALTEILYEMGCGEKIIGRSSYCDYPADVSGAFDVGSAANPDIEAIISLAPDLVLSSTAIASKDIFTLEQADIATVIIPSPTDIKLFSNTYTALGLIMNGIFTGADVGEEAFNPISRTLDNTGVVDFGKFVYITEDFTVATADTFESAVLSCFGTNVAATGSNYEYDKELLLENQPEIIILNDKYSLEDLEENEIFSQLDAVMNSKVVCCNNAFFERPSARIVGFIETLIEDYKKLSSDE